MAESLRDQLSAAFDKSMGSSEPVEPASAPAEPLPSQEVTAEPVAEAPKSDERARDEHGRFLPKDSAPAKQEVQAQPVELAKPRPPRPSSWKKDYWDHWEKLDPSVAEYINQRESEYAKGVSTYKTEWEKAKPLLEAVNPHASDFQRWGIDPAQMFTKYVDIHRSLALGTPEQKLATFLRFAQDFQVPVQNLFVRSQDGQIYFNQQLLNQPAQQQQPSQDIGALVQKALDERMTHQEIERMRADTKTYPHFEVVRQSMSGLLQSGLAQDLTSAYQAALRLPQHSEIWESIQQQERELKEKEKVEAAKKQAEAARRNAVSPKTATPLGSQPSSKKGLRATLEDAVETHLASRV